MEIKISKSARRCSACQREFTHEEQFNSLVKMEEQQLIREDFCAGCWDPARAAAAYSVWSPRYYDPKVAEQIPPEVFSPLRQAFYEAVEAEDRNELAKAYLAAHLLRRQKAFRLIKEVDDSTDEARIALFADRIGNRLIEVRDPNLTYAEMETGRCALMKRLNELEIVNTEPESTTDAQLQQT